MKTAITQNISWQLLIYDRSELWCKVTKFMCGFEDPTYLVVYMFWTKLVLVELGPYISIAILNTALVTCQCQAGPPSHHRAGPHRPKVVPSSPTECGSHEKGGEHDDHPLRDRHPLHHLPEHKARPGCVWGLQLLWTPRVTFSMTIWVLIVSSEVPQSAGKILLLSSRRCPGWLTSLSQSTPPLTSWCTSSGAPSSGRRSARRRGNSFSSLRQCFLTWGTQMKSRVSLDIKVNYNLISAPSVRWRTSCQSAIVRRQTRERSSQTQTQDVRGVICNDSHSWRKFYYLPHFVNVYTV